MEDWLMKKADKGVVKKWSWRWFQYDKNSHRLLYYVKEGPKMEMRGHIDLKDTAKVFVLPNEIQVAAPPFPAVLFTNSAFLL